MLTSTVCCDIHKHNLMQLVHVASVAHALKELMDKIVASEKRSSDAVARQNEKLTSDITAAEAQLEKIIMERVMQKVTNNPSQGMENSRQVMGHMHGQGPINMMRGDDSWGRQGQHVQHYESHQSAQYGMQPSYMNSRMIGNHQSASISHGGGSFSAWGNLGADSASAMDLGGDDMTPEQRNQLLQERSSTLMMQRRHFDKQYN